MKINNKEIKVKNLVVGSFLSFAIMIGMCKPVKASTDSVYTQKGVASWYGGKFNGRKTASGERLNPRAYTVAHKYLPFGTIVKITNLKNGKIVKARVNDRGPFVKHRIIDLSKATAKAVDLQGTSMVKIETVTPVEVAMVPEKHTTTHSHIFVHSPHKIHKKGKRKV